MMQPVWGAASHQQPDERREKPVFKVRCPGTPHLLLTQSLLSSSELSRGERWGHQVPKETSSLS